MSLSISSIEGTECKCIAHDLQVMGEYMQTTTRFLEDSMIYRHASPI